MKKKICKLKLVAVDRGDRLDVAIRPNFDGTVLHKILIVSAIFKALELTKDEAVRVAAGAVAAMEAGEVK